MQTRTGKIAAFTIAMGAILGITAFCPSGDNLAQAEELDVMARQAKKPLARVAGAPQLTDEAIAYLYLQTNLFEVEVAELGKTAGASDEVKQLAQMVANDHRGVVKSFEELLHMNHVKPTETPASTAAIAQHEAVIADLKARKGADFDKAYILFETRNHRSVIKALRKTLIPAVRNQAIGAHFRSRLPAFEHHLAMTLEAAQKLGIPMSMQ
jgi:putative membrane protein